MVAISGPPASGKSTLADQLAQDLNSTGHETQVVPMDGFHLDNRILDARGLRARKGSPDSFDAQGFLNLVSRIASGNAAVYPLFDRSLDMAIAGAGAINPDCQTILFEGNYLLLDMPIWRDLRPFWDFTIQLKPPLDVIEQRLIDRWLAHGFSQEEAHTKTHSNDLSNAQTVDQMSAPADIVIG